MKQILFYSTLSIKNGNDGLPIENSCVRDCYSISCTVEITFSSTLFSQKCKLQWVSLSYDSVSSSHHLKATYCSGNRHCKSEK